MDEAFQETLAAIQERNRKVELHKAWEISKTRRAFIAVMTYLTAFSYMRFGLDEDVTDAFMHAFVPMGGYLLSTYSLPLIRDHWTRRFVAQQTPKILPKT